jgi:uncharacterized lipoprotein NlpE involved in copper resistance
MTFRRNLFVLAMVAGVAAADASLAIAQSAPAAGPAASADQLKQLLTGAWRAQVDDPSGSPITMTLTLNADGTYTRVFMAPAGGEPPPPATNGTWTVQPAGDGRLSLTLVRTGQPAGDAKPLVFRVIDNDNLQNETENYRARRAR